MTRDRKLGAGIGDAMVGQLALFAMNRKLTDWSACDGTLLPIETNQTLFALLGTAFGGDGENNFALPDLRNLVPIHDPGRRGQAGAGTVRDMKLSASHLPPHQHTATFSGKETTAVASVPLEVSTAVGAGKPQAGGFLGKGGDDSAAAPIYVAQAAKGTTNFMLNGGEARAVVTVTPPVLFALDTSKPDVPKDLVLPHVEMMWYICLVGLFPQRP